MDESTEDLAPNGVRRQDVRVLIGMSAVLDGILLIGEMPDHLAEKVRDRFVRVGLLQESASPRDLRQALSDLNQRLRYANGEYEEPPAPIPVPD